MKRFFIVLFIILLMAGCSPGEHTNTDHSTEYRTEHSTPDIIPNTSASTRLTTADAAPSSPVGAGSNTPDSVTSELDSVQPEVMSDKAETDPDGKSIARPGNTDLFPLYAMIKEENIYLYGIHSYGMILYQNGEGTYFDWPGLTPRFELPQMLLHDFDGDGGKELAVTLYWGSGTEVLVMDLHILKIGESSDWRHKTTYTDYVLASDDVKDWMTEPITTTLSSDGTSFEMEFCGERYMIKTLSRTDENQTDYTFRRIVFGEIVRFWFEDSQIRTSIAMGARYTIGDKDGELPTQYFGDLKADVVFDGKGFRLENYSFTLY